MIARIKKGDTVLVIAGDDKGRRGKVLQVVSGGNRAVVEGLNFVKRHMRKTQDNPQGGIFEKEAPIHISNLKKAE
jgi:large subunit ribosomal protein L24